MDQSPISVLRQYRAEIRKACQGLQGAMSRLSSITDAQKYRAFEARVAELKAQEKEYTAAIVTLMEAARVDTEVRDYTGRSGVTILRQVREDLRAELSILQIALEDMAPGSEEHQSTNARAAGLRAQIKDYTGSIDTLLEAAK